LWSQGIHKELIDLEKQTKAVRL
jgi:hypothetical protein